MNNYPLLPTLILENKLEQSQIDSLISMILTAGWEGEDRHSVGIKNSKYYFKYQDNIKNIIDSSLPNAITDNFIVPRGELIHFASPVGIHSDYLRYNCIEDEVPYYFFVISLVSCDFRVIVLNQTGESFSFDEYKKNHKPLGKSDQISLDDFNRYFGHSQPIDRWFISIKDIFKWQVGSILAFDMRYYHASDNFIINAVDTKSCITLATKIKKNKFLTSYNELTNK